VEGQSRSLEQVEYRISELKDKIEIKEKTEEIFVKQLKSPNRNMHNSPIKRHHFANWIKNEDLKICCLYETQLIDRNKH
jgi:hypothetical protein